MIEKLTPWRGAVWWCTTDKELIQRIQEQLTPEHMDDNVCVHVLFTFFF